MDTPHAPAESVEEIISRLDQDGSITARIHTRTHSRNSGNASSPRTHSGSSSQIRKRAVTYITAPTFPRSEEGQNGSDSCFLAAVELVRGFDLDDETALDILFNEFNAAKCNPPWSEHELRHKIADARSKSDMPFGKRLEEGEAKSKKGKKGKKSGSNLDWKIAFTPQVVVEPPGGVANTTAPTLSVPQVIKVPIPYRVEEEDSPRRLADVFLLGYQSHGKRTIFHWNEDFYAFSQGVYRKIPMPNIRAAVYKCVIAEFERQYDFKLAAFNADPENNKPPVMTSPSNYIVANVIGCLQAMVNVASENVPVWAEGADESLTANDPEDIIATPTKLVMLNDYAAFKLDESIIPTTPDYLTLNRLDYEVNPDSPELARWNQLLRDQWGDDQDSIHMLQEWFGYLLTRETRLHKMLILKGEPGSGKGTILDVMQKFIGLSNVIASSIHDVGEERGLAGWIGKRLAVFADARSGRETKVGVVTERLLRISTGDTVRVRRAYSDGVDVKLKTRIVIACNRVPDIFFDGGPFARRLLTLSFYNVPKQPDRFLADKLEAELPSIFNWAVLGLNRLRSKGEFTESADSVNYREIVKSDRDPVHEFVEQCCECDPSYVEEFNTLWNEWNHWREESKIREISKVEFGRRLSHFVRGFRRSQNRTAFGKVEVRFGIKITTTSIPRL